MPLLIDEPLAPLTSWKVGGPARQLYKPDGLDDLASFVKNSPPEQALLWLGLGSNVLIRDRGFDGTVILTQGRLNTLEKVDDFVVRAEAGVACAQLARFCARQYLSGAEFMAGIPGTVGGALKMNAGCFGGETWDNVLEIETLDRSGVVHIRMPADYEIAYRSVKGPEEEWFLAATFKLSHGEKEDALDKIRTLLKRRADTQPTGELNCGSVFRNPPGDYAARLIESCNLKGHRIGGACVSGKHANFIINEGQASAADIEAMIEYVAKQVKIQKNIDLIREVIVI